MNRVGCVAVPDRTAVSTASGAGHTKASAARIVGSWASAGCLFGAVIGAITGGLIATTAIPLLAVIGVPVGALVGGLYGLAVGALDGIVLAVLNRRTGASAATNGRERTPTVAGITALAGFLPQYAIFGSVGGQIARIVLLVLPALGEATLAIWLSHRLPPARARGEAR